MKETKVGNDTKNCQYQKHMDYVELKKDILII